MSLSFPQRLRILDEVGVKFPSAMALEILASHGARVDRTTQVVRFPPDLVMRALASAPRTFTLGARAPEYDLHLAEGTSYFTTDGCGVATIDWDTLEERPSQKRDIAEKAIIEALAKIGAIIVQMDWLDLLVGWGGRWFVLEVKTAGAKLLSHQVERIAACQRKGLPAYVVHTPEEALQVIGATH